EVLASIRDQAALVETQRLLRVIDLLAETDARMKWAANKKLHFEVGAIKVIQTLGEADLDDVIAMVSAAAVAAETGGPLALDQAAAPVSRPRVAEAAAPAPVREEPVVQKPEIAAPPTAEVRPVQPAQPVAAPSEPAPRRGELEGEPLWEAAREALIQAKPLFETWLRAASFLSHQDSVFTLGFSSEQRFFRESLSRYDKDIEDQIRALSATPLRLEIVVRGDLAPVDMPSIEEEESDESAAPAAPEPQTVEAAESEAASPAPTAEEAALEESFKEDPLIREALKAFEARILPSK
ncbi:MAG TPA: hypothetical protein PLA50_18895, partial [Bacteroidia bacterium]|nr:hypothetical protein [Bacteroidia bacterium]